MKILIVSLEVWRNDQNGGNTLTNLFGQFPSDTEFAQVYCYAGMPNNNICKSYFNLTTKMVAKACLSRDRNVGVEIDLSVGSAVEKENGAESKKTGGLIRKVTNNDVFRNLIWKTGAFRSQSLRGYIQEFNPDIIFAPGYGVKFMNYLIQWIGSFANCPIVSLISDDFYSMKQMRFNPLYWIDHVFFRRLFRKTVELYDLIYTMTDDQKEQLEKDFKTPVKIVRKGSDFSEVICKKTYPKETIRFIYAGNIYSNRWKTLLSLSKAICEVNKESGEERFQLDIYSNGLDDVKIKKHFNETNDVGFYGSLKYEDLMQEYRKADIALHVEAFDIINRTKVQMSFSTKIIDCMASGCAIMCLCDKNQSGYKYLKNNDIAICVDNVKSINETLTYIYNNQHKLLELQEKAYQFGKINHNINNVSKLIYEDFNKLIIE